MSDSTAFKPAMPWRRLALPLGCAFGVPTLACLIAGAPWEATVAVLGFVLLAVATGIGSFALSLRPPRRRPRTPLHNPMAWAAAGVAFAGILSGTTAYGWLVLGMEAGNLLRGIGLLLGAFALAAGAVAIMHRPQAPQR